jgi:uncharacterized membrane protein
MDQQQLQQYIAPFIGMIAIFALIMWVIVIIPFWQIYKKAGFPPAIALLMIVPLANIITLYVVAFSQWKVAPAFPVAYPPSYPPPPPPTYPPQMQPPPRV